MGNKPVEKKRKKKGRPSLLDLQKRSLRLQKQQQQQQKRNPNPSPSPSPNPYLRFPNSGATGQLTRRNPDPRAVADDDDDDDDEDGGSSGKKREKKLKLVLRLPNRGSANSASDLASSGSESDGGGDPALRKRKIDAVAGDQEKAERHNSAVNATDDLQGDPSDSGPTTPLPDKKLLEFILDRLQKKDTYGVFSEPVDPEELPDYHNVIEHPMDFGTVRKKLSGGAYKNLEQFEKDVFLISSNAMRYNATDTIYYRQARSIQELAKKNFENLRQESDDNEPEPKTVRRGRPPSKNTIKRTVGRPPAERTGSDFSSDATLANAGDNSHWFKLAHDLSRKGSVLDRPSTAGGTTRTFHGLRITETCNWASEHRSEKNEEYSGVVKGVHMRYGKKPSIIEENRRNTYKQSQLSACVGEPSIFTTFDGEKKLLLPVGVHMEHAYARSLARFAAKLGPTGWEIAAKRIERALPPGTKFGRGWVGDSEAPQLSQQPLLSTSLPHPSLQPRILSSTTIPKADQNLDRPERPANNLAVEKAPSSTTVSPSAAPNKSSDPVESVQHVRGSSYGGGFNPPSGSSGIQPKTPFQIHQNPAMQPNMNGFNSTYGFNLLSQVEKMARPVRPPGSFGSEAVMMTHARALDMVSRSNNSVTNQASTRQLDAEKAKLVGNPSAISSSKPSPDTAHDSQGQWRGSSLNPKPGPVPPDLNVGFQSPGSPVSGVLMDSQQPDLALQL